MSSLNETKLSRKGEWIKAKSHQGIGNCYCIETLDGTKYLIETLALWRSLLSFPTIYRWQQFKAYRITDKEFVSLKRDTDDGKCDVNQKKREKEKAVENEENDRNFRMILFLMITGSILSPIFAFLVPLIAMPFLFLFEPFGFLISIASFIIAHALLPMVGKNTINNKIGKYQNSDYEIINLKIENNIKNTLIALFGVALFAYGTFVGNMSEGTPSWFKVAQPMMMALMMSVGVLINNTAVVYIRNV